MASKPTMPSMTPPPLSAEEEAKSAFQMLSCARKKLRSVLPLSSPTSFASSALPQNKGYGPLSQECHGDEAASAADIYVYKGQGEKVPKKVRAVVIDPSVEIIRFDTFAKCAALKFVNIPSSVTRIGDRAFFGCSCLTVVNLPDSVTKIGNGAFDCCSSLVSIHMSSSMTRIGDHAFSRCISLVSINIPGSVNIIGEHAFFNCTSLAAINIPDSVTTIEFGTFKDCTSLTNVNIPDNVTRIDAYAFENCNSLTGIKLPASVSEIRSHAFRRCTSLASISIPDSVTTIGDEAFSKCTSLTSISIPGSLTEVEQRTFRGCTSLAAISLPDAVTKIKSWAFHECASLTTINIPDSVVEIEEGAFSECTSLTAINIPSSVTHIKRETFYGCTSLTAVKIPISVSSIESAAFHSCKSLIAVCLLSSSTECAADAFHTCVSLETLSNSSMSDFLQCRFDDCCPLFQLVQLYQNMTKELLESFISLHNHGACKKIYGMPKEDGSDLTPLHIMLMLETKINFNAVVTLIEDAPNSTAVRCQPAGMTPLHCACNNPHSTLDIVREVFNRSPEGVLGSSDANNATPLALAFRENLSDDILLFLFSRHPLTTSDLGQEINASRLKLVARKYVDNLVMMLHSKEHVTTFSRSEQHGFVEFISDPDVLALGGDGVENFATDIINLIKTCTRNQVEALARVKDSRNLLAMDVAVPNIRSVFQSKLLFVGRYDIVKGPPIHSTETSIVVKAIDMQPDIEYRRMFQAYSSSIELPDGKQIRHIPRGTMKGILGAYGMAMREEAFDANFRSWDCNEDGCICEQEFVEFCKTCLFSSGNRYVAIKFFSVKEQFHREVENRKLGHGQNLDPKFVMGISQILDPESKNDNDHKNRRFLDDVKDRSSVVNRLSEEYKCAIVMPCADRDLDAIFRSEQPDTLRVRGYAEQIAEAIQYLHTNGIIHGDLKLLNIVRVGERLVLIDLDASCRMGDFFGSKFSSGIVPPEMIASINKKEHFDAFNDYFKAERQSFREKVGPKQSIYNDYVVKAFVTEHGEIADSRGVARWVETPKDKGKLDIIYSLVEASRNIDVWSFGVLLYELCAGTSLFEVDYADNIKTGDIMKQLFEWTEDVKSQKLSLVKDPIARDLISEVLKKEPRHRPSISDILKHEFFTFDVDHSREFQELSKKLDDKFRDLKELLSKVEKATIHINEAQGEVLHAIKQSSFSLMTAVFEATEVSVPTCFIILPHKIGDQEGQENDSEFISEALNLAAASVPNPFRFAEEFFRSKIIAKLIDELYFYLVDEYTGEPVCDSSDPTYPICIRIAKTKLKQILPVMAVGLWCAGLANNLAPLFGCPSMPTQCVRSAQAFVEKLRTTPPILKYYEEDRSLRGGPLRKISDFLLEHDKKRGFCNMKRIYDTSTGKAIWVKEEIAQTIVNLESEFPGGRLSQENAELAMKVSELEKRQENLMNELKQQRELNTIAEDQAERLKEETDLLRRQLKSTWWCCH